jgi:hypothetical protein
MSDMMIEALEESRADQLLVGDEAAAIMLADIIEGYRGGWVSERNARIALFASERRLGNVTAADGYTPEQLNAAFEDGASL